jgi:hypothetical protein
MWRPQESKKPECLMWMLLRFDPAAHDRLQTIAAAQSSLA